MAWTSGMSANITLTGNVTMGSTLYIELVLSMICSMYSISGETYVSGLYFGGQEGVLGAKGQYYTFSGCFSTDTLITVWDEKKKKLRRKKARDIKYTDKLLVWNFDKGCFDFAEPLFIQKDKWIEKYTQITFSDGTTLDIATEHAVFNVDKNKFCPIVYDGGCPIGTRVMREDGKIVTIVSKKVIKERIEYTNIITKYHLNVYANGILTSTPFNNKYPINDMKFDMSVDKTLRNLTLIEGISDEWIEGLRLKEIPDHIAISSLSKMEGMMTFKDYVDAHIAMAKDKE